MKIINRECIVLGKEPQGEWKGSIKRFPPNADQKIRGWPVKKAFLEEDVTAIRLGIEYWFADGGLNTSDSILGLPFLF